MTTYSYSINPPCFDRQVQFRLINIMLVLLGVAAVWTPIFSTGKEIFPLDYYILSIFITVCQLLKSTLVYKGFVNYKNNKYFRNLHKYHPVVTTVSEM